MLLLIETWSAACCWLSDLHQLLDRQAEFGEPLLDPGQRQRQRGALPLQPARELGDERAAHRRVRARHVGDHQDQALRIALRRSPSSGRPRRRRGRGRCGAAAMRAPTRRRFSISARRSMIGIAHSSPSVERRDRLVGGDEAAEALRVDPPVAVRDGLQRDVVDARQPGRRPVRQARQLAAVVRAAGAAARCGSAPRSGGSCRAAIRRPA